MSNAANIDILTASRDMIVAAAAQCPNDLGLARQAILACHEVDQAIALRAQQDAAQELHIARSRFAMGIL